MSFCPSGRIANPSFVVSSARAARSFVFAAQRRGLAFLLVALLLVFSSGCKSRSAKNVLLVSAAMSLRDAFTEAGRRFERRHPGKRVRFNFASSGTLATQIIRGAPVDVFASASQHHMNRVARKGLVLPKHRHDFARNTLVVIQPRNHGRRLRTVEDLRMAGKIAIGNPRTVPAGRYARAMLKHHKLWSPLRKHLVYGEHIRQVLDYVARNEVDAGLVYGTDYRLRKKDVVLVASAAPQSHPPIIYPVSVLKETRKRKLALLFVQFLLSAEGRRILEKHGFQPVRAAR